MNEARLKEHVSELTSLRLQEHAMERDPKFKKNLKRFYGLPSAHTVQRSHAPSSKAEKLDAYI